MPDGLIQPPHRRLRVYTFDPSLATQLETALINQTTLKVPWESLEPGPVGEYLEVVDYDPASESFYAPVDLDAPTLLAQDGHAPSEGNPQFHQQMVYAVAMTTIKNFESALGRKALWSPQFVRGPDGKKVLRDPETGQLAVRPVRRLRIYPHALREANAYYSPEKKALLFGYFPAVLADPGENLPGGLVFTCLSQDVVAHETTHALLDGLHRYYTEPSNADALAFHEAFADIVALFQHFSQAEALRHQIAGTRGDLGKQNLLGELAHQFGQAIGNHGSLRDAIGHRDPVTKEWVPHDPDPEEYRRTTEPHGRGAILVAALFDAFLAIYRRRVADLLRIATGGTGRLPDGEIHPDLVNRLAMEASKAASHLLRMAIRALDYCPPADITFGEYLRALVTGDTDLMPDDPIGYRIAVVEGFRRRGIYPRDVRTLAPDALTWDTPDLAEGYFAELLVLLKQGQMPAGEQRAPCLPTLEFQTRGTREDLMDRVDPSRMIAWAWLDQALRADAHLADKLGLCYSRQAPRTVWRGRGGLPSLEVHSVRSSRRPLQDGTTRIDLVVELAQRRRGFLDPEVQKTADAADFDGSRFDDPEFQRGTFIVRGGCTLLIDSETGTSRYVIRKPVASETRLARQRGFFGREADRSLRAAYSPTDRSARVAEPFAMTHRRH